MRLVRDMNTRLRAEFQDRLDLHDAKFTVSTGTALGFPLRRKAFLYVEQSGLDGPWAWTLSEGGWNGRRRKGTPLASVEEEVARILSRYAAGESPPFD